MEQIVIYKGNELSDNFLNQGISELVSLMEKRKLKYKDLVVCKSDTHLGTYFQWRACQILGLIPIFSFSEFSIESIENLRKCVDFKAIIETNREMTYIHDSFNKELQHSFLQNIEDGSVIHMTSASTGVPKLVLRTKTQLDAELSRYSKHLKINEHDVILPIVPISHSFGFISGMLLSMKVKATLVLPDILLPRNIIQLSNVSKSTFMLGLPYFYRKMLSVSNKYNLNEELRVVIASGGPMEQGLQSDFQKRFDKILLQQYGSSETGSLCVGYSTEDYRCVGKPIPGVEAVIIKDEWGNPCLHISSSETIGSYVYQNTETKLNGHNYKMGDLGEIDSEGRIRLLGRCDDILIVDGKKVNKNYVATVLTQIKGVEDVEVYLSKHNNMVELTCEYSGDVTLTKDEVMNHCRRFLAEYQIPKKFKKVKSIQKKETWKTGK